MKSILPRFFLASLLAALLVGLTGCGSSTTLNSIAVNVLSLETRPGSSDVFLNLRYANGNVVPVGVASTTHSFYLNGKLIGKTKSGNAVGLPPEKTADETISIRPENLSVLNDYAGKIVTYRIDSKLLVMNGEDKITITTTNSGPLDLSQFTVNK